ncbi:hypothetical protein [Leisingera aquaemixtae]|uniref:hypothetical protein n=1 Tax=Leisingera aquaemixtae TaxID=1396826 RepID=UPI0021A3C273|nr:hypothetical protein [Leisingera aquaemixtae]
MIENFSGLFPPAEIIVCSMRNSDLIEVPRHQNFPQPRDSVRITRPMRAMVLI